VLNDPSRLTGVFAFFLLGTASFTAKASVMFSMALVTAMFLMELVTVMFSMALVTAMF